MKKYYKDYKLIPKLSKNGKFGEDIEYTGKYYVTGQNDKELRRKKIYCLSLSIGCLLLLIVAGLLNTSGSRVFFIAIPYVCLFFPSVFGLMGATMLIKSDKKLERAIYDKSKKRIYHSAVGLVILNLMVVMGDFFYLFSGLDSGERQLEILFLFCMIIMLFINVLLLRIQNGIIYEIEESVIS